MTDRCTAYEVREPTKPGEIASIPRWCTLATGHEGPHMCRHTSAPAVKLREPIAYRTPPAEAREPVGVTDAMVEAGARALWDAHGFVGDFTGSQLHRPRLEKLARTVLTAALAQPRDTPRDSEDATLWALHIEGPDDVHPAPSREMAQEAADLFNSTFPQSANPNWPRAVAKVIEWPHGHASHAAEVGRFAAEWLTPRAAMQPPTGEPT